MLGTKITGLGISSAKTLQFFTTLFSNPFLLICIDKFSYLQRKYSILSQGCSGSSDTNGGCHLQAQMRFYLIYSKITVPTRMLVFLPQSSYAVRKPYSIPSPIKYKQHAPHILSPIYIIKFDKREKYDFLLENGRHRSTKM